ncbi:MAG: putative DNA binding domain-containing protein [Chloroflexi bacterium]|nr:putative DNA binding domain-containing protein [Chloroflexota bacterium]
MIEEELRALVRQGEGQRVEFKAAEADAADIARAIVAMANSGGGFILLGVSDDGDLLGLWYAQPPDIARHIRTMPDLAAWRQWVVNVSRHNCDPAVPLAVEHVEAEGRDVLVVQVPDGQDKPYRANGRAYVRIDREVHEATREEIGRLMFASGRVQYERLPVPDAALANFDDGLLRDYFADVRHLSYPDVTEERARLLVNLGFATHHAGRLVPTVAGLLLFGAPPQDHLPAATLKCTFFYGQHQGTQLRDRADVVGPLHRMIDEGAAFVARNRRLVPRMEGIRRVDVPEYPDYSVREALANALAHRDWSLEGAKVRLFIFDDRLEIWSPGKLPPPMTLERLGYDQFSRNRLIARVLVERGYIEEVGLGIRRMREEMARLGLPEPEFREDGFSFVITFRSVAPREGARPWTNPFQALLERGELNERQYRALLHVREHGTIARREYVALTGVSERTAASDLADLVRRELLEGSGPRGWRTTYRLREEPR